MNAEETTTASSSSARYVWTVDDAAPPGVRELIRAFPDLGGLPGVQTIKSNHFRSVFRVPDATPPASSGMIAKVYRYTSSWDRLRYRWIRHRALQEWTSLRRFAGLELPTARAWAVAEQRDGGSLRGGGLVVEFLPDTKPLSEVVHVLFADPSRLEEGFETIEGAARLVRRMHDRGVWHRDLHAGNLLRDVAGRLFLIDLHTCVFQRGLWRWQRRSGLAKLLHSLRNSIPTEGLRRIVQAYGAETLGSSTETALRDLLDGVERIHRVRVKSRSKRCFLQSTQFQVSRASGARLYHLRSIPETQLAPLFRSSPPGAPLQESRRGWVARGDLGGRPVCVKYRKLGLLESLQAIFESHRLRRAYGGGHALAVRGIASPQIIALHERRAWGLVREAHLVTELLEDALPLDQYLFKEYWGNTTGASGSQLKRRLAEEAGALVRRIHDCGLYPHDLSPKNVLVRPGKIGAEVHGAKAPGAGAALSLIDLDHLYLWKPLRWHARLKNLADLANLPEGHVSTTDRLRGLKAYAGGDRLYWSSGFVAELRKLILREHWKILSECVRRERSSRETSAS